MTVCKNKLPEAEEATATAAECTLVLGNCSGAVARGDQSCCDEEGEVDADAGPKIQVRGER